MGRFADAPSMKTTNTRRLSYAVPFQGPNVKSVPALITNVNINQQLPFSTLFKALRTAPPVSFTTILLQYAEKNCLRALPHPRQQFFVRRGNQRYFFVIARNLDLLPLLIQVPLHLGIVSSVRRYSTIFPLMTVTQQNCENHQRLPDRRENLWHSCTYSIIDCRAIAR